MQHVLRLGLAASIVAAAPIVACVGDDPSPTQVTPADASSDSTPIGDANGGGDASDASADADAATSKPCDPTSPFTVVAPVAELNLAGSNEAGAPIVTTGARLSPDQLAVTFASNRDTSATRLYRASRTKPELAFGAPSPVVFDQAFNEDLFSPAVGTDPNRLLFCELVSNPSPPFVLVDESTLAGANWGVPTTQPAGAFSLGHRAGSVYVTPDLLTIVLDGQVDGDGGKHRLLFQSDRASTAGTFTDHVALPTLDSDFDQIQPALSADKLTIYFGTNRATAGGDHDIWMAQRDAINKDFKAPVEVMGVNNSGTDEIPSWISPDQCTLYFDSVGLSSQLRISKAIRQPPP
jgi:hypothetical protein